MGLREVNDLFMSERLWTCCGPGRGSRLEELRQAHSAGTLLMMSTESGWLGAGLKTPCLGFGWRDLAGTAGLPTREGLGQNQWETGRGTCGWRPLGLIQGPRGPEIGE